jgi:hypothetical protein
VAFPAYMIKIFESFDLAFFPPLTKLKTTAQGEFDNDSVNH